LIRRIVFIPNDFVLEQEQTSVGSQYQPTLTRDKSCVVTSVQLPYDMPENMWILLILLSGMARFMSLLDGTAVCLHPLLLEGNHQHSQQSVNVSKISSTRSSVSYVSSPKKKQAAQTRYCHEYILLNNEVLHCITLSEKEAMMMLLLEQKMHLGKLDRRCQRRSGGL